MKTIQLVELFEDELLKSYDYVYYFMLRIIDKLSNNDNTAWGPNSPINLYHHIMIRIFKKYIYEKIDYEYSLYNYDISKANLLILEKIDGHTLRDRIYMETEVNDVKRIIFQVLYTLHVFNVNGIRHNDLHFNNIFIIYNKNPEKLSYYMNTIKQGFLFESTHIVKIYDFDLSYVERIAMKSKVVDEEHCMRLGLCNEPNPKFDTFKFLKELSMVAFEMRGLQKTVQEFIFDFIFECFPGGHNNILLKKDDTHLFDPDNPGNYIPPDDLMRSTEQILEFDTFKEFRTESKNEKDYTYTDKIIKLF
jgi:serine/threonine protein kinase